MMAVERLLDLAVLGEAPEDRFFPIAAFDRRRKFFSLVVELAFTVGATFSRSRVFSEAASLTMAVERLLALAVLGEVPERIFLPVVVDRVRNAPLVMKEECSNDWPTIWHQRHHVSDRSI